MFPLNIKKEVVHKIFKNLAKSYIILATTKIEIILNKKIYAEILKVVLLFNIKKLFVSWLISC